MENIPNNFCEIDLFDFTSFFGLDFFKSCGAMCCQKRTIYNLTLNLHFYFRSRIEKTNYRQKEKQVLDSILGKGYDKRIRPSGKNDTGKIVFLLSFGRRLFKKNIVIKGPTVFVLKKRYATKFVDF